MTMESKSIIRIAENYEAAWNSGDPEKVAACFAEHGNIVINRGAPWQGRARVAEMAAGFYADVNDMRVMLDELRVAGDHVAFIWTFTGRHAATDRRDGLTLTTTPDRFPVSRTATVNRCATLPPCAIAGRSGRHGRI
jgi:uncharacterized protein (TIGR02246 family)